jgi:hypothetical protein
VWSGTATPTNVDTGFFTNYNTGTTGVGYTHAGFYWDTSLAKWVLVAEYDPEPEGSIDTEDSSFEYGTLKAGTFEGAFTGDLTGNVTGNVSGGLTGDVTGNVTGDVTGNVTGNADTATALETARTIQLSGDVTGSATFDGSANINITATVGDDSHAHVISNVDGLQTALDAKADKTTTITAGNGFAAGSGGDLTANRTFTIGAGTGVTVNANDVAIGQDVSTSASVTFAGVTAPLTGNVTGNVTGNLDGIVGGTTPAAGSFTNITVSGTVDGRDVATDGTKLDGIEAGATADQTDAEIKTAYENNADTNAFTDALLTKLNGIEASADVTDAANVEPLVDAHINVSGASSGQYLGWNGTDYAWSTVDLTTKVSLSGDTMTGTLTGTSFIAAPTAVSVTGAATTLDFSGSDNFVVTMGADTTFTFSNVTAGQTGNIFIKQDALAGWSFTLPTIAKTPVAGATIVQDTNPGRVAILSYAVLDTSNVLVNYIGGFA